MRRVLALAKAIQYASLPSVKSAGALRMAAKPVTSSVAPTSSSAFDLTSASTISFSRNAVIFFQSSPTWSDSKTSSQFFFCLASGLRTESYFLS